MDIDLFGLRGVTVVKDVPTVELFSVRGVVVSKGAGAAKVSRARLLVSQGRDPALSVQRARLLISQNAAGFVNLPIGVTGLDQFKKLAASKMNVVPVWSQYEIGDPSIDTANGGGAKTLVTITAGPTSPFRGTYQTTYLRRDISVLSSIVLLPADFPTVRAVIDEIRRRNYLIEDRDIDFDKSSTTATSVTLVAADTSYLFTPSGKVVYGVEDTTPTFDAYIANGNLTGFTPA